MSLSDPSAPPEAAPTDHRVDVNVPRSNQAAVALLVGLAFLLQWWPLVAITAAMLALTRLGGPRLGLFTQAYLRLVRPRLSRPIETEPAAPPRFSQTLGAIFLGVATLFFVAGWTTAGWVVSLLVFALATLAAVGRICVGCIFYERVIAR
jgi:hypothetical protein